MTNRSTVNKNSLRQSAGFSLLELIVVMAILGLLLVTAAAYIRKVIDERQRQRAADAVAQDISGLLKFINADTIDAKVIVNGTAIKVNGKADIAVVNPLYQQADEPAYQNQVAPADGFNITANPLVRIHDTRNYGRISDTGIWSVSSWAQPLLPYLARTWSEGQSLAIKNFAFYSGNTIYSQPMKWSERLWSNPKNGSVRNFFTDSGCPLPAGQTPRNGDTKIYFTQQYLTCSESPVLKNSEIAISRIDLINSNGSRIPLINFPQHTGIDRVDVYISFTPQDLKPAHIAQYFTPLMDAFKRLNIIPDADIYLVKQQGISGDSALQWDFLDKNSGSAITSIPLSNPAAVIGKLAKYSDLPAMVDKLIKPGRYGEGPVYGLRFTFSGRGNFLRTDGGNTASKVCWHTKDNTAAPCLHGATADLLALKKRNSDDFATLQAASVILKGTAYDQHNKPVSEYYTAPHIQYASFSNGGSLLPAYQCGDATGDKRPKLCRPRRPGDSATGDIDYKDLNVARITDPDNGAIAVPLQTCPQALDSKGLPALSKDGKAQSLYPRISVAISSAISALRKQGADGDIDTKTDDSLNDSSGTKIEMQNIFHDQSRMLNNLTVFSSISKNSISINRLGGVVFHILQNTSDAKNKQWRIGSMVSTEDTNASGKTWQYFNPPWLSVVVTTWCSTVPQS